MNLWGEGLERDENGLEGWKWMVEKREKGKSYKEGRGKGGFVGGEWGEVVKVI